MSVILNYVGENKVEAIKVLREITHSGLKEAKDLIDGLEMGKEVVIHTDINGYNSDGISENEIIESFRRIGVGAHSDGLVQNESVVEEIRGEQTFSKIENIPVVRSSGDLNYREELNRRDTKAVTRFLGDYYEVLKEYNTCVQVKNNLETRKTKLGIGKAITPEFKSFEDKKSNWYGALVIGLVITLLLRFVLKLFHIILPFWPTLIVVEVLMTIEEIRENKGSNEAAVNHANREREDDRKRVDQEREYIDTVLVPQINEAVKNANMCSMIITHLNKEGVIFEKYQNDLAAIAQFYEYFASGRVSELTGPNGAYNLYEQELRQNLIINKLDVVIDRLDTVIDNQHMLYKAIQSTNAILQNIENNTAMAAYWAEVAAYNSEIGNTYGY